MKNDLKLFSAFSTLSLIAVYLISSTNFSNSMSTANKMDAAAEMMFKPKTVLEAEKLPALPEEVSKMQAHREKTRATRYETIKVDPKVAADEINFWSRQLSEHALFLHLGLEEPRLKRKGLMLHQKFQDYINYFKQNMSLEVMEEILPLIKELREYKLEVLKILNSGKWIGWLFPTLVRHITLELDYFVDKLNAIPYSDQDEIAFWNMINGDHAGLASHLLDPTEKELFKKADNLFEKFGKIVKTEQEMMIQISLKAAKELDEYNKTARTAAQANKLNSIIHPVLLNHIIREGERSIKMLNTLKDKTGAVYPPEITEQIDTTDEMTILE